MNDIDWTAICIYYYGNIQQVVVIADYLLTALIEIGIDTEVD